MEFKERFIEILEDYEICIKQLGKKCGINSATLYEYINNNYFPSVATAVKLANFFDCSLDYLLGLSNDEIKNNKTTYDITVFFPRYSSLLNRYNVTHNALSKKININKSSLLNWRKGKIPKMGQLILIAEYFGCSIDYLVGRSGQL